MIQKEPSATVLLTGKIKWQNQSSNCTVSQIRHTQRKRGIVQPTKQIKISTSNNIQFPIDVSLSGVLQQLLALKRFLEELRSCDIPVTNVSDNSSSLPYQVQQE